MKEINSFIAESIDTRITSNSLRTLKAENHLVDFSSNDYLGFARSAKLKNLFEKELQKYPEYKLGSAGSRLLAGNDQFTEDLEIFIASFHKADASLLFNSGYDANLGIFSSLPQRGDTVICDEYIHASIIDGARLGHASRFIFKHNDLDSLEQKLKSSKGRIFVAVESVYSMDGDEAPLKEICRLAEKFNAAVIVDEAHAIGVFGERGKGIVDELSLHSNVFARIVTFGKALGVHGAGILCSSDLRSYLINYARSFIYTTAPSFMSHAAIKASYDYLISENHQQELHEKIAHFKANLQGFSNLTESRSAIQILHIPGNTQVRALASKLQRSGFDVRPILSPTVPQGSERLRICIHKHNSIEEIEALCYSIKLFSEA